MHSHTLGYFSPLLTPPSRLQPSRSVPLAIESDCGASYFSCKFFFNVLGLRCQETGEKFCPAVERRKKKEDSAADPEEKDNDKTTENIRDDDLSDLYPGQFVTWRQ